MNDFIATLWLILGVSQLFKLIFNWMVYNNLNKEDEIGFGLNHPGMLFEKDGLRRGVERDIMVVYFFFICFWMRLPKERSYRVMAWSVLAISFLQGVAVYALFNLDKLAKLV